MYNNRMSKCEVCPCESFEKSGTVYCVFPETTATPTVIYRKDPSRCTLLNSEGEEFKSVKTEYESKKN